MRQQSLRIAIIAFILVVLFGSASQAFAQTRASASSSGFEFSVVSAHAREDYIAVQIMVKNTSDRRQYITACFLPSTNAVLTSGRTLGVDTGRFSGIPYYFDSDIQQCLSHHSEDAVYIEPGSELVVLLAWGDSFHGRIDPNDSASFPLNLVVRTAAAPGPLDSPDFVPSVGPTHLVSVSFPLIPLSGPR